LRDDVFGGYTAHNARLEREGDLLVIRVPMEFKRQSGRKVIIVPDGAGDEGKEHKKPSALLLAVARAFCWQEMMDSGTYPSLQALADSIGLDRSYVGRILKLAFLSPRIVESILRGKNRAGCRWMRWRGACRWIGSVDFALEPCTIPVVCGRR
jgi:hypothetical protein